MVVYSIAAGLKLIFRGGAGSGNRKRSLYMRFGKPCEDTFKAISLLTLNVPIKLLMLRSKISSPQPSDLLRSFSCISRIWESCIP